MNANTISKYDFDAVRNRIGFLAPTPAKTTDEAWLDRELALA